MRNIFNRRVSFIAGLCALAAIPDASAERRPNVVLIMADDVSWEAFSCYGAEDYKTPAIDSLAAKGVRFSHCYSTLLCTPSRVMIMTGQYNFRNYTNFEYLNPKNKTFGHLMQQAGYKTAIAGKWQLNGTKTKKNGYDDKTRPLKAGFDEACLWQVTQGKKSAKGGGERFWSPTLEINGKTVSSEENADQYGPDIMSDFVCNFIEKHQDDPFFVYYPTVLVHDPFVPTPDTIGSAKRDQSANIAPKSKKQRKGNFVAMVEYLDKVVAKIVSKVEEVGQLDNTIILFTADNGTHRSITSQWNGLQIPGGKGSMRDMGTHVPLIAYWKGHTAQGKVVDDLVDFTDIYPTIADAAGIELGSDDPIDGRSFLPQAKGKTGNPRDWVLCHYQPYWGKAKIGKYVRTQHYKLYGDGSFYNVPEDLLEENDLAGCMTNERLISVHKNLSYILDKTPEVTGYKSNGKHTPPKKLKDRPIHPDMPKLPDFK